MHARTRAGCTYAGYSAVLEYESHAKTFRLPRDGAARTLSRRLRNNSRRCSREMCYRYFTAIEAGGGGGRRLD